MLQICHNQLYCSLTVPTLFEFKDSPQVLMLYYNLQTKMFTQISKRKIQILRIYLSKAHSIRNSLLVRTIINRLKESLYKNRLEEQMKQKIRRVSLKYKHFQFFISNIPTIGNKNRIDSYIKLIIQIRCKKYNKMIIMVVLNNNIVGL